ncbi:ankyrin repeat-containing domain protein [Lasiosphaeria hispida]|uniref:Ankyrin repeat-containing domain protein n=1 Tax=Lasiosphaeria hispida TaxID=260671 RepID=A0AAJ0HDA6_9PEZI|nr:ankyrin repeat-containing domain protein [Lasiosphaeria hispida]
MSETDGAPSEAGSVRDYGQYHDDLEASSRGTPSPPPVDKLSREQKKRLVELLRFDQIDARLMTLKTAKAKTCSWFLKTPECLDWQNAKKMQDHAGFLWIKGKAGAGKSILMKFLLQRAKRLAPRRGPEKPIVVSFFFNARGEGLEKSTVGCYRSLLLQIFEKYPALLDAMDQLGSSGLRFIEKQGWHIESLTQTLAAVISLVSKDQPVNIFIDALDECEESEVREMVSFLEELGETALSSNARLNVCFSSRHYPSIVPKKGIEITLEKEAEHQNDISRYVESELRLENSKHTEEIKAAVLDKCSNIFLWVALVIPILNREYAHGRGRMAALRKRLDSIPPGLDDLFDMILTRDLENTEELHLCIQWILFSARPLEPQELFIANQLGVVQVGPEEAVDTRWDPEEMPPESLRRYIDSSSKGLAEVTRSTKPTVQFIHESVRDFLLGKDGRRKRWSGFEDGLAGNAQDTLKSICLAQVEIAISRDPALMVHINRPGAPDLIGAATPTFTIANDTYPFLEYASENVLYHSDRAQLEGLSQGDFVKTFPVRGWSFVHNMFERYHNRQYPADIDILYVLANYNLPNLIRIHRDSPRHFDIFGGRYGYPFLAAAVLRNVEALEALMMATGIDSESVTDIRKCLDNFKPTRGLDFRNEKKPAILYLVELGHAPFLEAYIRKYKRGPYDSDLVNSLDGDPSRIPLFWASTRSVAEVLLEHGADPNVRDNAKRRTPLLNALAKGNYEVADLLCGMDRVNVNLRDEDGMAAIHLIAKNASLRTMTALLNNPRLDVNAQTYSGSTALHIVCKHQHKSGDAEEIAMALLRHDFDSNLEDADGWTVLHSSAYAGFTDVFRFILSMGYDRKALNKTTSGPFIPTNMRGWTVLHCAAASGSAAMMQYILSLDEVILDSEDTSGRTPLDLSVQREDYHSISLLMGSLKAPPSHRVVQSVYPRKDSGSIFSLFHTRFWVLCEVGRMGDIFRFGGKRFCDSRLVNGQLFLSYISDRPVCCTNESTELDWITPKTPGFARNKNYCEVVRLLLEEGRADPNARDVQGRTPISYAAGSGNHDVLLVLLNHSATPDLFEDHGGNTPLRRLFEYQAEACSRQLDEAKTSNTIDAAMKMLDTVEASVFDLELGGRSVYTLAKSVEFPAGGGQNLQMRWNELLERLERLRHRNLGS